MDTETQAGRVVLLSTPRHSLEFPKSFEQCVYWLLEEGRSYLAFNLNFDAQALLHLLPARVKETLAYTTRAEYHPRNGGLLKIRFLPGKFLRMGTGRKHGSLAIYDIQQFTDGTLNSASRRLLGEDAVKDDTTDFKTYLETGCMGDALRVPALHDRVVEYCEQDAWLTEQLGGYVETLITDAGLSFDKPASCATLARQYWGSRLLGPTPRNLEKVYWRTYYGGRIECPRRGYFPDVVSWDIHSAYPSVIAGLHDPRECLDTWAEREVRADAAYAAILVDVDLPKGAPAYPIPVRIQDGVSKVLIYPWGRWRTWVDLDTYRVTEELFPGSLSIVKLHQYIPLTDNRPFARMADLYETRRANPELGLAFKLVMNSTYGLLAERMPVWKRAMRITPDVEFVNGDFLTCVWRSGAGANPVLASKITGAIRARILRETWGSGTVLMYSTDGVLMETGGRPSGACGSGLGEWGLDAVGRAVVVGTGVYAFDDGDGWRTKLRGFPGRESIPELLARWPMRRILPMSSLTGLSLRQIVRARNTSWADLNDLRRTPRDLDVRFDRKRRWPGAPRAGRFMVESWTGEPWAYHGILNREGVFDTEATER